MEDVTQKAKRLLLDIKYATEKDALRYIEKFLEEEVDHIKKDQAINSKDLCLIKDLSLVAYKELSISTIKEMGFDNGSGADYIRTYSYLEGVIGFLRKSGLISFKVFLKK